MAAVVSEDWGQVIAGCDLDSWKEALTAVLTHTKGDEFSRLCGMCTLFKEFLLFFGLKSKMMVLRVLAPSNNVTIRINRTVRTSLRGRRWRYS